MDKTTATAIQPLAPQLIRYGISILGTILASRGVNPADLTTITDTAQVVVGGAIAILPPLWRVITTLRARKEVG